MGYDWDAHKETCYRLYIGEKKTLEDIISHMRIHHKFNPRQVRSRSCSCCPSRLALFLLAQWPNDAQRPTPRAAPGGPGPQPTRLRRLWRTRMESTGASSSTTHPPVAGAPVAGSPGFSRVPGGLPGPACRLGSDRPSGAAAFFHPPGPHERD